MIKNKVMIIKIIFKNIKNNFRFINKLLFYKTSYDSFQKLFLKTIFLELF